MRRDVPVAGKASRRTSMRFTRRTITTTSLGLLLGAGVMAGGAGVYAQDASPVATDGVTGRPAHIHAGSCDELGEVVAPLSDLTLAAGGTGDTEGTDAEGAAAGNADAIPAEYSFTTVDLSLDDILAADHAINIHESADNIDEYIACGDLGGTVDANGSLVVGLQELNDSGYAGIAVLSPSTTATGGTDVSVFIAEDLTGGGGAGASDAAEELEEELEDGTPEADS
jgi:hypothetical protein